MGSLRRRDLRPTHRIIHTLPENFKDNLIPDNIYVGVFICGRRKYSDLPHEYFRPGRQEAGSYPGVH